jgi:hypothetical protein
MTQREIRDLFEEFSHEYLKFNRIKVPMSKRPDLHAFLMLDKLVPRDRDMIAGAEHDEIHLDIELSELTPVVTVEEVIDLIRCGIRIHEDGYHLCMFV